MTDKTELNIANQYFRLAIEYTKQTKLDQAIEAYHSAILIDSEQASVYNNLGFLYAQKGNLFKAVQSYLNTINHSKGCLIEIEKGIPPGSGIGSSAASAAAALVGINELMDKPLST